MGQRIEVIIGDDFEYAVKWLDGAGQPVTPSDYSGTAQIRAAIGGTLIADIDVDAGTDGWFYLSIPGSVTALLVAGIYAWGLDLKNIAAGKLYTLLEGNAVVKRKVVA
jgi:hypothetical protein